MKTFRYREGNPLVFTGAEDIEPPPHGLAKELLGNRGDSDWCLLNEALIAVRD